METNLSPTQTEYQDLFVFNRGEVLTLLLQS